MSGRASWILPIQMEKNDAVNLRIKRPPFVDRSVHCKLLLVYCFLLNTKGNTGQALAECHENAMVCVDRNFTQKLCRSVESSFW